MIKQKKTLEESLVEDGLLTPEQLEQAKQEEKRSGHRLRKVLVRTGLMHEDDLVAFLSAKSGLPRIELENYLIDPKIIELIPEPLARKYELIPVLKIGKRLTCAMTDPWNIFALDELRAKTGYVIEPAVATEGEIKNALDSHYGAQGTMKEVIRSMDEPKKGGPEDSKEIDVKKLQGMVKEPIVIKLVNLMITEAIRQGASDIHIEPEEETLKTRFRVDGMLREETSPPKHLQSAVISRVKILANLDIAERRAPQDGRFNVKTDGKEVDIRVSCMPTVYGENVVLRLLDVSKALLTLEQIGLSKDTLGAFQSVIKRPYGIILVTGPTGSGKTTTLYSSLDKINTVEKNILTIEDPVEYRLPGVRQIQVNTKAHLTFSNGLRSILRQDPDVIMVGEIRDAETAEIAIQAALTGHLVLATLHTNDAPGAITRLIDMGVEPFLVSSSVIGILAQRLVRTLCKECKEEYVPSKDILAEIGVDAAHGAKFYRGKGCIKCMKTGYKGRIAIFEFLVPNEKIRKLAIDKASSKEMRKEALAAGMIAMKEDGMKKIAEGLTTLEEVLRVTREE